MNKTALSLVAILALGDLAYAGDDIAPVAEPIIEEVPVANQWEFRLSPYGWFAGFRGDVASIPGLAAIPVDISSSDALSDTEISITGMFEAKKNGKGLFMDFLYSDMQSEETLVEVGNKRLVLNSTSKTTIASIGYLHEIYHESQSVVDLFAGIRYWNIDSHLSLSGGLGILPPGDHEESWVDPLIGIKGRTAIGDTKFYVAGGAAIGGFGVSSDLFYDLNANLGYQWSNSIGTSVGYRLYDLDYENDGFVYDVRQEGWVVGLTWAF